MKIAGRLARLASRYTPMQRAYQIVLYDAATGVPLPGHEPNPKASGYIWIPDNGRGAPLLDGDEPHEGQGGARCG